MLRERHMKPLLRSIRRNMRGFPQFFLRFGDCIPPPASPGFPLPFPFYAAGTASAPHEGADPAAPVRAEGIPLISAPDGIYDPGGKCGIRRRQAPTHAALQSPKPAECRLNFRKLLPDFHNSFYASAENAVYEDGKYYFAMRAVGAKAAAERDMGQNGDKGPRENSRRKRAFPHIHGQYMGTDPLLHQINR